MESFINEAPGLQHTTHEWHILDIIISIFWCIQNKGQFNITKVNIYIISLVSSRRLERSYTVFVLLQELDRYHFKE